ncbi:hypothetical protein EG329_011427 [Mollisiaceae sp. DMI_Dod_QoI]|nr:hypothetical protein EG329_011427 [Helotiales sp. DMI_Dod_QoI]
MVRFSSIALFAIAMLSPLGLADELRDPRTSCTTYVTVETLTETRFPKEVVTSVILYEYPTTTTVYVTDTSTVLYTTDRTRVRTRTDTATVSQCTVH